MTYPPVSVVTIAYNATRFLPEAVASTLAQTDGDFEYLIIDDGSTDATQEMARSFAADDKRIRVLTNERNLGIAATRNRGIREARGRYIMWLNADDISVPIRLQKQREFLDEHPEVVYVGGYMELFSEQGTIAIRRYPTDDAQLRRMFHRFLPVSESAGMVRRETINRVGPYDMGVTPADDLDMTFRLARVGKLANLPEMMVRYRISDDMATVAKMSKMARGTWEIRRRYIDDFPPTLADRAYGVAQRAAMLLPLKLKMRILHAVRDTPPGSRRTWLNRVITPRS